MQAYLPLRSTLRTSNGAKYFSANPFGEGLQVRLVEIFAFLPKSGDSHQPKCSDHYGPYLLGSRPQRLRRQEKQQRTKLFEQRSAGFLQTPRPQPVPCRLTLGGPLGRGLVRERTAGGSGEGGGGAEGCGRGSAYSPDRIAMDDPGLRSSRASTQAHTRRTERAVLVSIALLRLVHDRLDPGPPVRAQSDGGLSVQAGTRTCTARRGVGHSHGHNGGGGGRGWYLAALESALMDLPPAKTGAGTPAPSDRWRAPLRITPPPMTWVVRPVGPAGAVSVQFHCDPPANFPTIKLR